uniref:Tc1-like transposase DDE domain-containing protein n=1 Tax=Octopus bimaculoides TaxID=37653 RepID=A0A0L8G0U6_OCTBM
MWSDEASFKLNTMINCHNCVIYATENPHLTYEQQLNQPGVTVWGALSPDGLLGSIFFMKLSLAITI